MSLHTHTSNMLQTSCKLQDTCRTMQFLHLCRFLLETFKLVADTCKCKKTSVTNKFGCEFDAATTWPWLQTHADAPIARKTAQFLHFQRFFLETFKLVAGVCKLIRTPFLNTSCKNWWNAPFLHEMHCFKVLQPLFAKEHTVFSIFKEFLWNFQISRKRMRTDRDFVFRKFRAKSKKIPIIWHTKVTKF